MREMGKVTTAKMMNTPTSYPNKGTTCECVCVLDEKTFQCREDQGK